MDLTSRTAQLCVAGNAAEFERRLDAARALFQQAWDSATNDYEASIAAHYIAHLATDPASALRWDIEALRRARLDQRAAEFLPSLYVSLASSFEKVGNSAEARRYFELAAELGLHHHSD